MNLYPFDECAKAAEFQVNLGNSVHQQFNCAGCGIKQTMAKPNRFYESGTCEECGHTTDIKKNGCNYMVIRHFK